MKKSFWPIVSITILIVLTGFAPGNQQTPSEAQSKLSSPPQQPTPEPSKLAPQVLLDASVSLDKCFSGTINGGMVPCGSPPGTEPLAIDAVWPQTVQFFEFTLNSDAFLALEVHRQITDQFPGTIGVDLHYLDPEKGDWAGLSSVMVNGTRTDQGSVSGSFDPEWANKVTYDPDHRIYPAGQYRIMAWEALAYDGWGAVIGYIPSQGSFKVYAFENIAPLITPTLNAATGEVPSITTTPTTVTGNTITLSAIASGYAEDQVIINNSAPFAKLIINGRVVDQITGEGIEGAVISILEGAEPQLALTDANGSYSLTATVPGGTGSNQSEGVDFILPPKADLTIEVLPDSLELLADGVSQTKVTIQVKDLDGMPLPNRTLSLELDGAVGPGTLHPNGSTTDLNGKITATYTSFKLAPGTITTTPRHEVTITARDLISGAKGTETVFVNQYLLTIIAGDFVPACVQCDFPITLAIQVTDYWLNPIPNTTLVLQIEEGTSGGGLAPDLTSEANQQTLNLITDSNGRAAAIYRWKGSVDINAVTQRVFILDEITHAQLNKDINIHGLDLGIKRVEEAGFTGITGQQAFLKVYIQEYVHPELSLDRFNAESSNKLRLKIRISQYHSDGVNISTTYESTGGWEQDEKGFFVKMENTPYMPFIIPVNDGGSWYEIRVDFVADNQYLPDQFRANNDTIFALTTGSADGWLHIWLRDGILTPHNWAGVVFKCVGRFLPVVGDAITVIDTLNQSYNQDALGLGQSSSQVISETLQGLSDSKTLTKVKAGTINNVVSCLQDTYTVHKQPNAISPGCPTFASQIPVHFLTNPAESSAELITAYQDRYVQGILLDSPELRGIVVAGLDAEAVNLRDKDGILLSDPNLESAEGKVTVFLLPADEIFQLELKAVSNFDIAVYEAGSDENHRTIYHYTVQTETPLTGSLAIRPSGSNNLEVDQDGDGSVDKHFSPTIISLDVVKPAITQFLPSEGEKVYIEENALMAGFTDQPGGSGIDLNGVKIFVNDVDLTAKAMVKPGSLILAMTSIGPGDHTARLIIPDLDGNATVLERSFTIKDKNTMAVGVIFGAIGLGGGFIGLLGIGLILARMRHRTKKQFKGQTSSTTKFQPELHAWLIAFLVSGVLVVFIFGSVSLIGLHFFPNYRIKPNSSATIRDIMLRFGIGCLTAAFGFLILHSGIRSLFSQQSFSQNERKLPAGQRRPIFGFWGFLGTGIGIILLISSSLFISISVYQHILPWLGF